MAHKKYIGQEQDKRLKSSGENAIYQQVGNTDVNGNNNSFFAVLFRDIHNHPLFGSEAQYV